MYRTPVNVFERGDGFIFALTYGPERDWVRNVLDADRFTMISHGRNIELIEPMLERLGAVPGAIPAPARAILRGAGVHTFLLARRSDASGLQRSKIR